MATINTKYFSEEDHIQYQIVEWMKYAHKEAFFIHVANEGRGRISFTQMEKIKGLGVKKGAPDLLFFDARHGFHGLAIEVKTPTGTVSREQQQFLTQLSHRGWLTHVARSFEKAQQIINDYYGNS